MKCHAAMLLAAVVLASAQVGSAQDPVLSSVPFTNSFEGMPDGTTILMQTNYPTGSWTASVEDAFAYVTNLTYSAAAPPPLPEETFSHTNLMKFSSEGGEIVNGFDTNSTKLMQTMWIETMIQPVFSEELPVASVSNSHLSICFLSTNGSEGYISVYHGAFTNQGPIDSTTFLNVQADTNVWSIFPNNVVASGAWVRLSVEVHYADFDSAIPPFFKVALNGNALSNAVGMPNPPQVGDPAQDDYESGYFPMTLGGPRFRCTKGSGRWLSQIALAGTGALDDLLVSNTKLTFTTRPTIRASIVSGNGTLTPLGNIIMPSSSAGTNFVMASASNYFWEIESLTTGDLARTISGLVSLPAHATLYDFAWSNLVGDNLLEVKFKYLTASNGVPYEWLANAFSTSMAFGASSDWDSLASSDPDQDGMPTVSEWVSGTIPTDSNSLLRIIGLMSSLTTNVTYTEYYDGLGFLTNVVTNTTFEMKNDVRWLSSTSTLYGTPYTFEASTNMNDWTTWPSTVPATVQGTNVVRDTVTRPTPTYYRVKVAP